MKHFISELIVEMMSDENDYFTDSDAENEAVIDYLLENDIELSTIINEL